MHEHIPDSANTYIMVSAQDLKNFGSNAMVASVVGAVLMVGFAYWWEANEDDRKAERKYKKSVKEMKVRHKAAEKAAKRAQ